jgi:hypothetical protein
VTEPTAAKGLAVRVSVDVPLFDARVTGLSLKEAVTPLGNPETARFTTPWKDPPLVNVKRSVALAPSATVTVLSAGAKVSVGLVNVTDRLSAALEE